MMAAANMKSTSTRLSALRTCSLLLLLSEQCNAWVLTSGSQSLVGNRISPRYFQRTIALYLSSQDVVDVDFERIGDSASNETKNQKDKEAPLASPSTLFDLSLDSDPEWKEMRIPFIEGDNYIDGKLAFMTELDGVNYGIAIPFESAAAITFEKADGTIEYMSPDNDENEEIMQIMAAQLQEHVGADLTLKRTPRVLTISGPIDDLTKNWETELLPSPVDKEALLDESDESLDFFQEFMKKELGDDEYEKTMRGEDDDTEISDDLLKLFNVPGMGTSEDDTAGLEELFGSLLDSPEEQLAELEKTKGQDLSHQGMALKLVSYQLPDKKSYSLVKLLQPYALIGKYVQEDDDVRFELLSIAEAKLVVPRLEKLCQDDLKEAGLELQ